MEKDKEELVRQALAEVGEESSEELARFIEQHYGVRIDPRFVPVLRASLRERDLLEGARAHAKAVVEQAKVGPKTRGSTDGVPAQDAA